MRPLEPRLAARLLVLSWPLLLFAPSRAIAQADPLWARAVEAAGRAKMWVPGSTAFRLELMDDKGQPTGETQEMWYRLSAGPDGDVVTEVVRSLKNGKDNTAEEREKQEGQERGRRKDRPAQPFSMGDNPLDPEAQDRVEAKPEPGSRTILGRTCVSYGYVMKTKTGRILGNVWLARDSGLPLEMTMTLDPLPAFVQKMDTRMRYEAEPPGEGRVAEVLVEGSGGVLFLKRNFRMSFSLDGWWLQVPAGKAP